MSDSRSPRGSSRGELLLIAFLGLALYLPGLGGYDLWNPDEPRYAEVAREMLATGRFLVPHLNGEIYSEKPPLHFWAISLAALIRGQLDELAVRLPSVMAAIGTLLLTFSLARLLFGRFAAWISVAALATCYRVMWQGRFGQIDMLLTFLVTLGVWFWAQGLFAARPRLYPLFFVATGLATLAKGPAGLLPPLLAIVAFLLLTGRRQDLRRLRVGRGLLLWLAVVLAWLLPAGVAGGRGYLLDILYMQNIHRYVTPGATRRMSGHLRPWYYYLTVLPAEFFPWSLLLPSALWIGWRELPARQKTGFQFALSWFLVTLLFFSLSPAKRSVYVLTLYPAMALLLGAGLTIWARIWPRRRLAVVVPHLAAALVLAALATAALKILPSRPELAAVDPRVVGQTALAMALALVGALLAAWWSWRGRAGPAVASQALGMALMGLTVLLFVVPDFDLIKSARPLAAQLTRRLPAGEPYAMYPKLEAGILFYSERHTEVLQSETELVDWVRRTEMPLVIARARDLAELRSEVGLATLACDAAGRDGWCLVGPADATKR